MSRMIPTSGFNDPNEPRQTNGMLAKRALLRSNNPLKGPLSVLPFIFPVLEPVDLNGPKDVIYQDYI